MKKIGCEGDKYGDGNRDRNTGKRKTNSPPR